RKAVSIDTKKKIITLHEVGMSKHMISKHCEVSRNCVMQTIRKYDETQSVATKPGSGRKPKLTERQKRAIKIEQLCYNSISLNDLVKFVQGRYQPDGQRYKRSQPRSYKGGGLGISGCLTYYGLSDLFFYDGNIDSSIYIEILEHTLPSTLSRFSAVDRCHIWTEIPLETIHKLYSSIPKRLKQIIQHQDYAYS
ncbi:unnamed protein product, partial [Rotaria sordida]